MEDAGNGIQTSLSPLCSPFTIMTELHASFLKEVIFPKIFRVLEATSMNVQICRYFKFCRILCS